MTSPDFRAAFALDAKDLLALRTLCDHVEDDEFQTVMIITIVGIAELLDTARKEIAEASCPDLFRTMFMSSSATSSSASSSSYNQMCPRQMCPRGLNESMSISSLSGGSSRSHDDNALEIDTAFANQPMPMYTYSDEDLDDLSSSESDIDPFRPPMFTSLRESALYQVKAVFPNSFDDDFETLSIKDIGDYEDLLCYSTSILGVTIIELDNVCNAIFNLTTIRSSEWNSVETTKSTPKKNRTINSFNDCDAKSNTRFSKNELHCLLEALFGKQRTNSYTWKRHKFTYEETLLIALDYMANGHKYQKMKDTYGGNWTLYSYPVNFFARYLYHKFYHRLSGRSMEYWAPHVEKFRKAIWLKVCFDEEKCMDINVLFAIFAVFSWIDAMQHQMSRPGGGPIDAEDNRRHDENQIQRAFFTSYGKMHGMKTLALYLPNGMIGSVFFTSISHNDKGCVNLSGIEGAVKKALEDYKLPDGITYPTMYGDEIFEFSEVMTKANGVDDLITRRLTSSRGDVEHIFGLTSTLWKRTRVKHTWELMKMKKFVRAHLFSIFFMTNCYSCIHGNKTSTKYGFTTYSLEDYLNVDANDAYDGDDSDDYMASIVDN
jgi:hypothetical protein